MKINTPTDQENADALKEYVARAKEVRRKCVINASLAHPALARLVEVCRNRTGQGYKLRSLLYSLWNGQSASLSAVLNLDHELREDFCAVVLAFGFESSPNSEVKSFFYDAMRDAFKSAGLYEWFLEARNQSEK